MVNIARAIPKKISLLLAAVPCLAHAGFSNMLWVPAHAILPEVTATPLSDGLYQSTIKITPPSGRIHSLVVSSSCKTDGGVEKNDTSSWIMFPNSGVSDSGVKWSLVMSRSGGNYGPLPATETGGLPGYQVMNFSWSSRTDTDPLCLEPSNYLIIDYPNVSGIIGTLTVDKQAAKPGHHLLSFPMYWGFEENKYTGGYGGQLWRDMGRLLKSTYTINAAIPLTINSRCTYKTAPILLDHGVVAPSSPDDKFDSQAYGLDVQCDAPAQVSMELKAMDPVSSMEPNVSLCAGGRCELTLAVDGVSGLPKTSVKVEDRKTFYIKSSFKPGSKWRTGKFKTQGVLLINVE